eukprot:601472-Prymnesium_polylepis.1
MDRMDCCVCLSARDLWTLCPAGGAESVCVPYRTRHTNPQIGPRAWALRSSAAIFVGGGLVRTDLCFVRPAYS